MKIPRFLPGAMTCGLVLVGGLLCIGVSRAHRVEPEATNAAPLISLAGSELGHVIQVGNITARTDERFVFILLNDTSFPVQILGCDAGCSRQGCIVYEGLPITLAIGQHVPISYIISAQQPGHLVARTALYTTVPGKPSFAIRVEGEVMAANTTSRPTE